jgi:hypothetical protein
MEQGPHYASQFYVAVVAVFEAAILSETEVLTF